jgi:esterase/lipase
MKMFLKTKINCRENYIKFIKGSEDTCNNKNNFKLKKAVLIIYPHIVMVTNLLSQGNSITTDSGSINKVMKSLHYMGRDKSAATRSANKVAVKCLSEIKVPALIPVGEYDIPDIHAHAGVINAGIPNSKREIISGSGHLILIEQSVLFNEAVMTFLIKLSI